MPYTIPESVQKTAAAALALYEQAGTLGMAVAVSAAKRLAKGGKVDDSFIRKLSRYYPKGTRAEDPMMTSLWGGREGKSWAESTAKAHFSGGADFSVRVAEFALDQSTARVEGDYRVYPNSILFQAGDFPDKQITITPDDLAKRVAASEPCYLNLEHSDLDPDDPSWGAFTALDGILGEVSKFWMDPGDPTIARGEVYVLRVLDDNLKKRGLSMEVPFAPGAGFDGGAITYTPRITGAAMMSEAIADFKKKKEHTHGGLDKIQRIHDIAEQGGAVCKGGDVKMSTAHEVNTFQLIHDTALEAGAKCQILSPEDVERIAKTGSYYYSEEKPKMPFTIKNIKTLFTGWLAADMPSDYTADHVDGLEFAAHTPVQLAPAALLEGKVENTNFTQTEEYKAYMADLETQKAKVAAFEAEKAADFSTKNSAVIASLLAADKIEPAKVEFCTNWRAKDTEAFDAHFSTVAPLGNLTDSKSIVVDGDTLAAERGATSEVNLASPFSEADLIALRNKMAGTGLGGM